MQYIAIYFILLNIFAILTMGYDKKKARERAWRVSEAKLFLIALLGGAGGIFLGMKLFHHKTKHAAFRYGIPLLVIVNLIMYALMNLQLD